MSVIESTGLQAEFIITIPGWGVWGGCIEGGGKGGGWRGVAGILQ